MIIVFEGPDFVGKTTQAILLAKVLPSSIYQKSPFKLISDNGESYNLIYEKLNNGKALQDPSSFQKLFIKNRSNWINQELLNLQKQYKHIIIDRWSLSTWIYGANSGLKFTELIYLIEEAKINIDIQFIFSSSIRNKKDQDCFEEKNFQFEICQNYDNLIFQINNINEIKNNNYISCINTYNIGIDSNQSIENIHQKILLEINNINKIYNNE